MVWKAHLLGWGLYTFPGPSISLMDFVFLLSTDARGRFLQSATRKLGCSYICLWSPLSLQSKYVTLSPLLSSFRRPSSLSKTIYISSFTAYKLILGDTSISHLASIDGWYHEDDSNHRSSSSGSISRRLFKAYQNSLFSIDSGYCICD